jgi:hypothetical protein
LNPLDRDEGFQITSSSSLPGLFLAQHPKTCSSTAPEFAVLAAQENAANSKAGPRIVPGRVILVPDTVSPQLQAAIAAPFRVPAWFHNGLAMRKCCDSSERDARTKCTDRDCDGDDPSPDTSTPRRRRDRDFGRDR